MRKIVFIALCAFLASCLPLGADEAIDTIDDVPSPIVLPSATPTVEILESPSPTPFGKEFESPLFEIKKICPSEPIKDIENLGLPEVIQLVVLPVSDQLGANEKGSYAFLSSDLAEPRLIQSVIPPAGLENRAYAVSPDGYWIRFYRVEKSNFRTKEIIVSPLDGDNLTSITHFANPNQAVVWLSNGNKLVVWGDPNAKNDDPYDWFDAVPLAIINPVTLEIESLEALPLNEERYPGLKEVFEDELSLYILYSYGGMPFDEFVLYSYTTKSKDQVFQWLTGIDTLFFDNTRFYLQDNTFSVFIEKSYGFDIATEMRLDDVKRKATYDQMMKKIVLPTEVLPSKVLGWNSDKNSILFFSEESLGDMVSYKLFSLDVDNKLIYDYCFKMPENFSRIHLSPDGNFAAFSYPTETSNSVIILNLGTGYLSILENYGIIGWGRK